MFASETKFIGMNITNGISGVTPGIRIQAGAGANNTFTVDVVPAGNSLYYAATRVGRLE